MMRGHVKPHAKVLVATPSAGSFGFIARPLEIEGIAVACTQTSPGDWHRTVGISNLSKELREQSPDAFIIYFPDPGAENACHALFTIAIQELGIPAFFFDPAVGLFSQYEMLGAHCYWARENEDLSEFATRIKQALTKHHVLPLVSEHQTDAPSTAHNREVVDLITPKTRSLQAKHFQLPRIGPK